MLFSSQYWLKARRVGTKFHPIQAILNFWTKLTQKGYFPCVAENVNMYHWISHIRSNPRTNFIKVLSKFFVITDYYKEWQEDFNYYFWTFLKKIVTKCDKWRMFHEFENNSQPANTCLKLTIETLEQGMKYVQS